MCGVIINFVYLFRQIPVNIYSIGCSDITTDITIIFLQQIYSSFCVCSCGSFMKHAVCGHILGYIYRHTKLDQECWFGSVLFVGFIIFYKHFNNSTLIFLCVIAWIDFFFITRAKELIYKQSSENHDFYVAKRFFDFHFFFVTMLEKTCAIDIDPYFNYLKSIFN